MSKNWKKSSPIRNDPKHASFFWSRRCERRQYPLVYCNLQHTTTAWPFQGNGRRSMIELHPKTDFSKTRNSIPFIKSHRPNTQKHLFSKQDWLSDDFGSRSLVIQKKKRCGNVLLITSIVERVIDWCPDCFFGGGRGGKTAQLESRIYESVRHYKDIFAWILLRGTIISK